MTLKNPLTALLLAAAFTLPGARAAEGDGANPAAAEAAAQPRPYKYKTPKLDRAKFDALLTKPGNLLILDVRRPDELSRIGGFPVYLSIQSSDLQKNLAFIPKGRSIVTVSNHAGRAGAAADLLAAKGYKVVGAVGAQNYEEEGGTLTRITPPPPKQENATASPAKPEDAAAEPAAPAAVN